MVRPLIIASCDATVPRLQRDVTIRNLEDRVAELQGQVAQLEADKVGVASRGKAVC